MGLRVGEDCSCKVLQARLVIAAADGGKRDAQEHLPSCTLEALLGTPWGRIRS